MSAHAVTAAQILGARIDAEADARRRLANHVDSLEAKVNTLLSRSRESGWLTRILVGGGVLHYALEHAWLEKAARFALHLVGVAS